MVNLSVQGYPFIVFGWALFAISTPFVFVRLYVQLRFRSRPWRELFVLAAWLFYLGYSISESLENDYNGFNKSVHTADGSPATRRILKADFVAALVYKQILYCCKAAMLCLYQDLTPRCFRKIWWAIRITWAGVIIGTIFHFLFTFLDCRPLSKVWIWSNKAVSCSNIPGDNNPLALVCWFIHLTTDLAVYILPFIILRLLPAITRKQKRTAYLMFGLGFLNLASAVTVMANFIIKWRRHPPQHWYFVANQLCMAFQAGTAVIIICIPYMRRLWAGTSSEDLEPGLTRSKLARAIDAIGRQSSEDDDAEATEEAQQEAKEEVSVVVDDASSSTDDEVQNTERYGQALPVDFKAASDAPVDTAPTSGMEK